MKRGSQKSVCPACESCSESRAECSCRGALGRARHLPNMKTMCFIAFAAQLQWDLLPRVGYTHPYERDGDRIPLRSFSPTEPQSAAIQ